MIPILGRTPPAWFRGWHAGLDDAIRIIDMGINACAPDDEAGRAALQSARENIALLKGRG